MDSLSSYLEEVSAPAAEASSSAEESSTRVVGVALPGVRGEVPEQHVGLYTVTGLRTSEEPNSLYTSKSAEPKIREFREKVETGGYNCRYPHPETDDGTSERKCNNKGGIWFSRKSDVDRHLRRSIIGVQWECRQCGHQSQQKAHHDGHWANTHGNAGEKRRFHCLLCPGDVEMEDSSAFHRHFDSRHPEHAWKIRQGGKKRARAGQAKLAQRSQSTKRKRDDSSEEEPENSANSSKLQRVDSLVPPGYQQATQDLPEASTPFFPLLQCPASPAAEQYPQIDPRLLEEMAFDGLPEPEDSSWDLETELRAEAASEQTSWNSLPPSTVTSGDDMELSPSQGGSFEFELLEDGGELLQGLSIDFDDFLYGGNS